MNKEFVKLVSDMREAQKKYFRTRDKGVLVSSKELEKMVDRQLNSFDNPNLF